MGLFNFIRSAGRVLGMGGHDAVQDESKAAPAPPSADAVRAEIERLGLPAQNIDLRVEGDTVHVGGNMDSETREKVILAAGNVAGIASVNEAIATPAPAAEPRFHTVAKGDTLSAIAKQVYGNASRYPAIFEANKPMLSDPNRIYPGQVLRIPPA